MVKLFRKSRLSELEEELGEAEQRLATADSDEAPFAQAEIRYWKNEFERLTARTIVYEPLGTGAGLEAPRRRKYVSGNKGPYQDDWINRLVKYIPAEVVAFFAPIAGIIGNNPVVLQIAFFIGAIATFLYLLHEGLELEAQNRPYPTYYVLAVIAFLAWALATNSYLAHSLGVSQAATVLILAGTAVLIVPADSLLARACKLIANQRSVRRE